MPDGNREVSLRPATAADRDFLMKVFAATRGDELAVLGDAGLIETFVKMQFDAQQHTYNGIYPDADSSIILVGDEPAGRLLVNRGANEIRLVDIALLPEFRSHGTGSVLLKELINEARESGRPLLLSVYQFNPALSWYERHGFLKVAEEGLYIQMQLDRTHVQ